MAELTDRRSAWHRLDVLQAVCDTTRPQPDVDGADWVEVLERDVDVVLDIVRRSRSERARTAAPGP